MSAAPLWRPGPTTFQVKYGRSAIERILPHRPPMLLLDTITHVDVQAGSLRAQRRTDPDDPVFRGHMPGAPIYPAMLLVEMVAQAAACLAYFISSGGPVVGPGPLRWLEDRLVVHRASFTTPVGPGDGIVVLVKLIEAECGSWRFAGQALLDDEVRASVVVQLCTDGAKPIERSLP